MGLAILLQGAVHASDGFVKSLDHAIGRLVGGFGQNSQPLFGFHRHGKIQVDRVPRLLRKRPATLFGAAAQLALLFEIEMDKSGSHKLTYITVISQRPRWTRAI